MILARTALCPGYFRAGAQLAAGQIDPAEPRGRHSLLLADVANLTRDEEIVHVQKGTLPRAAGVGNRPVTFDAEVLLVGLVPAADVMEMAGKLRLLEFPVSQVARDLFFGEGDDAVEHFEVGRPRALAGQRVAESPDQIQSQPATGPGQKEAPHPDVKKEQKPFREAR
jgi:hypothetical protein